MINGIIELRKTREEKLGIAMPSRGKKCWSGKGLAWSSVEQMAGVFTQTSEEALRLEKAFKPEVFRSEGVNSEEGGRSGGHGDKGGRGKILERVCVGASSGLNQLARALSRITNRSAWLDRISRVRTRGQLDLHSLIYSTFLETGGKPFKERPDKSSNVFASNGPTRSSPSSLITSRGRDANTSVRPGVRNHGVSTLARMSPW